MTDSKDWALRAFRPGDLGMVAARQAALYASEWGWGRPMEAMIYEIAGRFLTELKPDCEQGWVAERGDTLLGGVFVCEEEPGSARLRLLYVEPEARGLGVGGALVRQCTAFAREAGYERMVLSTHAVLDSARKLYAAEGYRLISSETQTDFGKEEVTENWQLDL